MEKRTAVAGREDTPSFNGLDRFEATVITPSTKLYANGRQQIGLEVLIIPSLDGEPWELKQSEKDSIRLVHYTSEAELSDGWKYWEKESGYDFYTEPGLAEPIAARESPSDDGRRDVFNMFITTTDDVGLTRKLALAITRESDGLVIITNAKIGSDFVGLDYAVTVEPLRLPSYNTNNYAFEKQLVHGQEGTPVFIYNYYVGLVTNSNESVAFKEMQIEGGGMVQWEDRNPTETFASYVGYGQPGDSTARYNPNIVLGSHTAEKTVRSPIADKGTIILAGNVDITFHADSAIKYPGPCTVTAIDANGNDHTFYIRFNNPSPGADDPSATGRFDLVLYK